MQYKVLGLPQEFNQNDQIWGKWFGWCFISIFHLCQCWHLCFWIELDAAVRQPAQLKSTCWESMRSADIVSPIQKVWSSTGPSSPIKHVREITQRHNDHTHFPALHSQRAINSGATKKQEKTTKKTKQNKTLQFKVTLYFSHFLFFGQR